MRNLNQYLNMRLLKHISIFLLISFMFNCCVNEHINIKTDLEKYKLKGKVKKIEKNYWTVKESFGEITKIAPSEPEEPINTFDFFRELHFNEKGNLIRNVYFDNNNSPDGFTIYTYDNYNRIIKHTDDKNNTIDITYNDNDFTSIIHSIFLNLDYPWEEITQNYYDKNSNLIKEETFKDGKLILRTFYEYDNNGALISEKQYGGSLADQEGELSNQINYVYDNDGNIGGILKENKFGKNYYINNYNEYNDIISITFNSNNSRISYSYEYKYDNKNNWIERIEYYSFENYKIPRILTTRKIEYY